MAASLALVGAGNRDYCPRQSQPRFALVPSSTGGDCSTVLLGLGRIAAAMLALRWRGLVGGLRTGVFAQPAVGTRADDG